MSLSVLMRGWLLLVCLGSGGCTGLPLARPQVHLARGDEALARRNFDAALAEFQQAVKLDPQLAQAHAKLGLVYKEKGELSAAADSLETAVRLDPFQYEPTFELGEVYRLLNRLAQAIRAYLLACEMRPSDFEPRFRAATCQHQAGDLSAAIENYRKALELDPKNALAWSNLGAAHDQHGQVYESINAYKRSLECNTNQPLVLVNLATAYLNQERWSAARRTLQTAVNLDPRLSVAQERLGYCKWREQDYAGAADAYLKALNLDSHNAAAYAGYGVVRMTQYLAAPAELALRDEAIEAWHQSLELDADQPPLRTLLDKYRPKEAAPLLSIDK